MPIQTPEWAPTRFVRFVRSIGTSTGPAEIVTDRGRAYLKALGNKEGPHSLAAEWIGTALADWLGLRTFALAKLVVAADDEIQLGHTRRAAAGPAIAVRAEDGSSWNQTIEELAATKNVEDVAGLVVLDTWLLNCDRYPADLNARKPNPDNIFLSEQGAPAGKFLLTAMDHTHCFACGRELNAKLANIDRVKDPRVYGRFPEFESFLRPDLVQKAVARLCAITREDVATSVEQIENDWEVSSSGRVALTQLVLDRADFVATTIQGRLFP